MTKPSLWINVISDGEGHDVILTGVNGLDDFKARARRTLIVYAIIVGFLGGLASAIGGGYGVSFWPSLVLALLVGGGAAAGWLAGHWSGEVNVFQMLGDASTNVTIKMREPGADPDAPPEDS